MGGVGSQSSAANRDRLTGWKEIAAHLGKGVRTVQRWERELGLPVHRIKASAGEILFASAAEIDRWQRNREDAARAEQEPLRATSSAPGPEAVGPVDTGTAGNAGVAVLGVVERSGAGFWITRRAVALAGVVVFVCAAGAVAWIGLPHAKSNKTPPAPPVGSGPTAWRVEGGRLEALDADKHVLWSYDKFPAPLNEEEYRAPQAGLLRGAVTDVDGDGHRELLLAVTTSRGKGFLYCFNPAGTLRFARPAGRHVRFGDKTFAPPFNVVGFQVAREAGGRQSIWVAATHHYDFPAVVEKRDARGELLSEYWSNGHIDLLTETTMGGRRVMLVGATNNESGGASLAILDYDHPSGFSPAVTKKYTCTESATAQPLRFFLFPTTDVFRALGSPPYARKRWLVRGPGRS